jgi:TolA-binding protein
LRVGPSGNLAALGGNLRVRARRRPTRSEWRLALYLRILCVAALAACGASGTPTGDEAADAGVGPVVERAEAAKANGDLDAAIQGYAKAVERTPWNTRLKSQLVAAYAERAEKERRKPGGAAGLALAEKDLRDAHALAPDDAAVTRSLAAILVERAAFEADDDLAAKLRAEATQLSPEVAAAQPEVRLPVERRIDLAYDLIDRGNLDAGIDQLDSLVREYPHNAKAARLLAQALVRLGGEQTESRDYDGAKASFTRAVELYAQILPCDGTRCDSAELALAHRNRILSALDAQRLSEAKAARREAEALGLRFDDLQQRWPELFEDP